MMEEKQKVFASFMDEFGKLNAEQKNSEIVEKQKLILEFLIKFATEHGIEYEFLKSKRISDIEVNNETDEDYLETIMVYTENIEELLGLILSVLQ